jgi:hypothetical protein
VTVDEILAMLDRVKQTQRGWRRYCPAHDSDSRSLSIAEGDDGRVLLKCWVGCTLDKITAALGLQLADLFPGDRDQYATSWEPKTREERQATRNRELRRRVRALELDQRRATLALHRASLLIAIAYSDDPAGVLDRLWRGAVDQLEAEAAAAADAAA